MAAITDEVVDLMGTSLFVLVTVVLLLLLTLAVVVLVVGLPPGLGTERRVPFLPGGLIAELCPPSPPPPPRLPPPPAMLLLLLFLLPSAGYDYLRIDLNGVLLSGLMSGSIPI